MGIRAAPARDDRAHLSMDSPRDGRLFVFRAAAVVVGALGAWLAAEAAAFLMPLKQNPFYIINTGGAARREKTDPRLPHTRAPHLRWEGWSQGDVPEWIADTESQRRRISFETDAGGFRNSSEISRAQLVFIDDSLTEAGNVAEDRTFVRLAAGDLGCTAKNLGVFGYDPLSERIVLERHGLACEPRAVIWQICEGNDLRDSAGQAEVNRAWEQSGRVPDWPSRSYRVRSWQQRSPFHALRRILKASPRWWLAGTFRDARCGEHEMRFGYWPSMDHFPLGHPSAPWGKNPHPGWTAMVDCIEDAKSLLDREGIALVVLYIPMKITVYARYVRFDEWSVEAMPYYPPILPLVDRGQSLGGQLELLCRRLGIAFVDATPDLEKAAAAGELVYFPNDTHLSERGHEIVAESLHPVLSGLPE